METTLEKKLLFALILTVGIIIGGVLVLLATQPGTLKIDCEQVEQIANFSLMMK